jgi:hypothetical protein
VQLSSGLKTEERELKLIDHWITGHIVAGANNDLRADF